MYSLDDIIDIHLEITTKCNAGCPMCPRHHPHTSILREDIGNVDITFEKAKKLLQPSLIKNLKNLLICGNYGDAITNMHLIPILELVRQINPSVHIILATNGGARASDFWKKIAKLVNRVDFAIDGLKDTNHIYRQFVNWDILERNIKVYISESIKLNKRNHSRWVMNIFKHNEHQINEAKKLAKFWGISIFRERYSSRFVTMDGKKVVLDSWPVYDDKGNLSHTLYPTTLDYPENYPQRYNNDSVSDIEIDIKNIKGEITKDIFDAYNSMYDNFEVECISDKYKSLYIDYMGKIYPCCWFAQSNEHPRTISDAQVKRMYQKYGDDFNDLSKYSIESIFDKGIFEEVELGLQPKNISCGKTMVCVRRCAKKSVNHKIVMTTLNRR
jgi:MoaA/NifB/PqqE/SkfB family radical SAM enzyme